MKKKININLHLFTCQQIVEGVAPKLCASVPNQCKSLNDDPEAFLLVFLRYKLWAVKQTIR